MGGDKYTATWVSHTSICDFLECPRAYFLKHMYRDPDTKHKVKIVSPPLALGQAIHEVLESLSVLPAEERFNEPLINKYLSAWKKVAGKKGGFLDTDTEQRYKSRGEEMLKRVSDNPGPIGRQAVKIKMDLPHYWLSEDENIILCGKIDWLEYLPVTDSVNIIDFKTGKNEEDGESLQLPIYHLLAHNCQKRKVEKLSYWYLDRSDELVSLKLPDLEASHKKVLEIARKIKLARTLDKLSCSQGNGCRYCKPYEEVLKGHGELVGSDEYNADVYILKNNSLIGESEIL